MCKKLNIGQAIPLYLSKDLSKPHHVSELFVCGNMYRSEIIIIIIVVRHLLYAEYLQLYVPAANHVSRFLVL